MAPQGDAALSAGGSRSRSAEAEARSAAPTPTRLHTTAVTLRARSVRGMVMTWLGGKPNPDEREAWVEEAAGLLWAAREGEGDRVRELLTRRLCADVCDRWGNSALILGCVRGHVDVVQCLLAHGATPNHTNAMGGSPLFYAATRGFHTIVRLLLRHGARLGPALRVGGGWGAGCWHPLVGAAANGHAAIIHTLLHLHQDQDQDKEQQEDQAEEEEQEGQGRCSAWELALWAACARGQPLALPPLLHHPLTPVMLMMTPHDTTQADGKGKGSKDRGNRDVGAAMALASKAALQAGHPQCYQLLQWLEGSVPLVYVLSKLRAIADCQAAPPPALSRRALCASPLPSLTIHHEEEEEGGERRGGKRRRAEGEGEGGLSVSGVLEEVVCRLAPDAFDLLSQLLIGQTRF